MTKEQLSVYKDIFKELELTELSVKEGDLELTLKKECKALPPMPFAPAPLPAGEGALREREEDIKDKADSGKNKEEGLEEIKAPLIGVFHRGSGPDADAFVSVGDHVKQGDVLCIIEAMKMMNEITAAKDCVIEEICALENDIVEYGQVMFRIS